MMHAPSPPLAAYVLLVLHIVAVGLMSRGEQYLKCIDMRRYAQVMMTSTLIISQLELSW